MNITSERLQELIEICNQATPGPWFEVEEYLKGQDPRDLNIAPKYIGIANKQTINPSKNPDEFIICRTGLYEDSPAGLNRTMADNHFIFTARAALPEIITELMKLKKENEELKEENSRLRLIGF